MVNVTLTTQAQPAAEIARQAEWRLILSYAPADRRAALAALWTLDGTLGDVMRATSEPMLAQMRYTWWHDALTRLDGAPPPAMPVLQALADAALSAGVTGSAMAPLVEGWEALIEGDPADPATRAAFAMGRGEQLFTLAAQVLGAAGRDVAGAGKGWALVDLSRRLSDDAAAAAARNEARALLAAARMRRWPVGLRVLGALAVQAAMDVEAAADLPLPGATPGRVARLAWHRLTGR